MLVMALVAAKSSLAFQMRMRNPLRVLKNLLGLADWRNVNVGNEERKLFTERNLGPIMEKSGVTEELLAAEDLDGSGDEVYGVSRGESVGLETRAENNLGKAAIHAGFLDLGLTPTGVLDLDLAPPNPPARGLQKCAGVS